MKPALVVVDYQRYYLDPASDFYRRAESRHPRAIRYIAERCANIVTPNILLLQDAFRDRNLPVFFLRLCGTRPDRTDLHRHFFHAFQEASAAGFPALYPLAGEPLAEILTEVAPLKGESVTDKTTYSAFSSTGWEEVLSKSSVDTLFFTGLATSQCVATTSRDASDRGWRTVLVEDALADYTEAAHAAALHSQLALCAGLVVRTHDVLGQQDLLEKVVEEEDPL